MAFVCRLGAVPFLRKPANSCSRVMPPRGRQAVEVLAPELSMNRIAASSGPWHAVGDVSLPRSSKVDTGGATSQGDIGTLLSAYVHGGLETVERLNGTYAAVIWNANTGACTLLRDPLGVRSLYWTSSSAGLIASSHLDELPRSSNKIDLDFVADFLIGGGSRSRSVWTEARQCPPGTAVSIEHDGSASLNRFWEPKVEAALRMGETEAAEGLKHLLAESVRDSVTEHTWSQLSGGVDSSILVCIAHALHRKGALAQPILGTITITDTFAGGVDARLSRLVAEHVGVANYRLEDYDAWQGLPAVSMPPQPTVTTPYSARQNAQDELLRAQGANVLLSGAGCDELFLPTMYHITDRLVGWGALPAIGDLARSCAEAGNSFWEALWSALVTAYGGSYTSPKAEVAPWITPEFARQFALVDRVRARGGQWAPSGSKYSSALVTAIEASPIGFDQRPWENCIETRYPYLYRPLVEYCLRLPPAYKNRPPVTKWLLRQAVREVLPTPVLQRRAKDGIEGRFQWSLKSQKAWVDKLLERSPLAQLSVIDTGILRRHVETARNGTVIHSAQLLFTLALDSWLAVTLDAGVGAVVNGGPTACRRERKHHESNVFAGASPRSD